MDAAIGDKLRQLATDDTYLASYARRRASHQYDRQLLTFDLAVETYAVDITWMREIIKVPRITEVPRVPPFVCGVVTVRGQVIPVIDLRLRLGLPAQSLSRAARILITIVDDEPHGMLVDCVHTVVRLRESDIETSSAMSGANLAEYITGLGRVGDDLLILLDVPSVVLFRLDADR
jgi:purine-binding chemotaxis protein CheW